MAKYVVEIDDNGVVHGGFAASETDHNPGASLETDDNLEEIFRRLVWPENADAVAELANALEDSVNRAAERGNKDWPYVVVGALVTVLCDMLPSHDALERELQSFADDLTDMADEAESIYQAFQDATDDAS